MAGVVQLRIQSLTSFQTTLGWFLTNSMAVLIVFDSNERALIAGVVGSALILRSSVPYSLQGT